MKWNRKGPGTSFDGGLNSFFSPSLATFIQRLLADSKKVSDGIVEKRATGLADYPDEILWVRVHFFNLTEGQFYLVQIKTEEKKGSEADDSPLDLRELKGQPDPGVRKCTEREQLEPQAGRGGIGVPQ